jgi:hypothetical protein
MRREDRSSISPIVVALIVDDLSAQKFDLFNEQWQPKVIAEMNDYQFKVVKLQGDS